MEMAMMTMEMTTEIAIKETAIKVVATRDISTAEIATKEIMNSKNEPVLRNNTTMLLTLQLTRILIQHIWFNVHCYYND